MVQFRPMGDETSQIVMSGFYLHDGGKTGMRGPAGDLGIIHNEWQALCARALELLAANNN